MRSSSRSTTLLPYGWTILWPVFHYQIPDHPKSKAYEDHSWIYYEHVNQAFADKIVKSYKRGDIIWIHDYHLLLAPGMVRKKSLSDIRIRIKVLHNFSRMRRFQPYSAVVEAVKASEVLELTEDEEVRRKVPLDEKFGNSYDDTNLDPFIFKNTHGRGGHTRPPHRRTVNRRPPWSLATARFKAFRRK
ncbi:Trehalose synthase complex regulatory subunit TPS3 [Diplodia seriata]|uniref:Trehalose synthase complex regulatory subunit TPS3 n=1 Tax=Diplodia seriata TaxID=420778 RepID=A0A1S8B8G2_9PEZI|nr:Trehalose synthase complex regulatory subunit TPS3 [Diplodia seriata]